MAPLRLTCSAVVLLIMLAPAFGAARPPARKLPVLLVYGITRDIDDPSPVWGRPAEDSQGRIRWTGLIGSLDAAGFDYGGVLQPQPGRFVLPEALDTTGTHGEPSAAALFVLEFSPSAAADGLAYKALEVAQAIEALCRFTGAQKVRIVAHSAGGLAARMYLQNALPGVPYRGDVDRLITISTPHLGAAIASQLGDLLGTRVTSLKPDAPLIRNLNRKLDLPADTTFASIVVRGFAADTRGSGSDYDHLVDHPWLDRLPIGFQIGGDQVVHVRSQNLRLAGCAARYEKKTGRPVQYVLVRVPDPSPADLGPFGRKVHTVAPGDQRVRQMVARLLQNEQSLFEPLDPAERAAWIDARTRVHTTGIIEAETLKKHPASEVKEVRIDELTLTGNRNGTRRYAFSGQARSVNVAFPLRRRWTRVRGSIDLRFDQFGRVVAALSKIEHRSDR